jgi:hypothetical protein
MAIISIPTAIGGVSIPGQAGQIASGPLAALFGSKGLTTINYPQDLAIDATKSHYVQFSIKEIEPVQYNIQAENTVNAIGSNIARANAQDGPAGVIGSVAGMAAGAASSVLNKAKSAVDQVSNDPQKAATEFVQYVSNAEKQIIGLITDRQTTSSKAVISLYMPDNLTASYNASYTEVSLKDQLGSNLNTLRTISEVAMAGLGAKGGLNAALSAVSSDPAAQKLILDSLGKKIGAGSELSGLALQSRGYASNPQLQMIYKGLDFRRFSLAFTFTPKSRAEAELINNIVYQFKYYSAPSFQRGKSLSNDSMFLIPPAIFNVKFMVKGIENKYLPKYTDCVLEDVNVNYAPNGWAAHTDGAPIQTQLSLSFKEIEVVDKNRLSTGYNDPMNERGLR